ncbi:hypothetical protein pneo_cds_565 [Pandoravirus neocaledonia]|uniref:Ankyrin repeat domain containing protein n=1 Tax=Pandoravirus neocaledonia TaxID=2107708 RepID=A0A2U7UCQ2_9VIRU|nr:hypothetical protein pneo_cds_565 [Pandoravirus neocaledonia]AVK76172.1 hypothetical protein pneo_cds_565 [Pandoravirus neocaledonia]
MTDMAPAIDALPDEVLYMIMSEHIDDNKDIGACLLAWRRFRVLGGALRVACRCRHATLLSLCASGDMHGLRFAAARPDIYGPAIGFRWDACLYSAVVADNVDVLEHIKARILDAMAAGDPHDGDPPGQSWVYNLLDGLRMIRARALGAVDLGTTWPLWPAPWLALAAAAALSDCPHSLAWLCADGNRPATMINNIDIKSLVKDTKGFLFEDHMRFKIGLDLGVLIKVVCMARNAGREGIARAADHVAEASGFDVVPLLDSCITLFDAVVTPSLVDILPPMPPVVETGDDAFALAKADNAACVDGAVQHPETVTEDECTAAWWLVSTGGLADLCARHGDDAVLRLLQSHHPVIRVCNDADAQWRDSLLEDMVWLYKKSAFQRQGGGFLEHYIESGLLDVAVGVGRIDMVTALGYGPGLSHDVAWAAEQDDGIVDADRCSAKFKNLRAIATVAANDGRLDMVQWACRHLTPGCSPDVAWRLWQEGRADAARLLCAHGFDRVPSPITEWSSIAHGDDPMHSPLYASIRARDTEALAFLLDGTAADDFFRPRVDDSIGAAVSLAVDEALADGDSRSVEWLARRYPKVVAAALAVARETTMPLVMPRARYRRVPRKTPCD